jgi:peptidoglycan hydrolase-like protein with peptidoglycan-binding domain
VRQSMVAGARPVVARAAAVRHASAPHARVIGLQRLAGNRAVAAAVQRSACCSGCAAGRGCSSDKDDDAPAAAPSIQRKAGRQVLRQGSLGGQVAELQDELNRAGSELEADGRFGPATGTAVRAFQESRGLDVDGVVGNATWEALDPADPDPARVDGPAAPGKITDEKEDFRIRGLPSDSAQHADTVFFDFAESAIPPSEETKLPALAAAPGDVVLEGTSSEEGQGNQSLTDGRISSVASAMSGLGHAGQRQRKNSTSKAVGQLDYRKARKVRVGPVGADAEASCQGKNEENGGTVVSCPSSVKTAFTNADTLLGQAVTKLGSASTMSASEKGLVKRLFADDSDASIAEVAGHMSNLQTYVQDSGNKVQGPGQPPPTGAPFHRCLNTCNAGCAAGSFAFNRGVDADSDTSFCDGFTSMSSPAPGTGTTVTESQVHIVIHESAHGTKVIDCKDFAKGTERAFGLLNREQALHNADSFTALARNLVNPGSAATNVLTPDTGDRAGDRSVEEPLAWLDRWLEAADFDTSQLYGILKDGQEGRPWPDLGAHFARTMRFTSDVFPVTAPPAAPQRRDRERIAAINDRYDRVRQVLKTNTASLDVSTGAGVVWAPGPGRALTVPADFGTQSIRRRIELLLLALLRAAPEITEGREDAYARLAPRLCDNRAPGFAFSAD